MKWYLSFASEKEFLGACVVHGNDFLDAIRESHARGCNPGGEVCGSCFPGDLRPEAPENGWPVNTLLTVEFLVGQECKTIQELENQGVVFNNVIHGPAAGETKAMSDPEGAKDAAHERALLRAWAERAAAIAERDEARASDNDHLVEAAVLRAQNVELSAVAERARGWIERVLQHYEGMPLPSEIEGKNIAAELARLSYLKRNA